MKDPNRNSAMIPNVKRILARRSGVRNALTNAPRLTTTYLLTSP